MKRLVIIGAGGYGGAIADIAEQLNIYEEILFLDDGKTGENIKGKCTDYVKYINLSTEFYPAFGNNSLRVEWLDKLNSINAKTATIIHSTAFVSPKAVIECGTAVLQGAVVNTNSIVKRGGIININAVVDHDCIIEEGCHICINAVVKAENKIPPKTKIEAGEIIQNRTFTL